MSRKFQVILGRDPDDEVWVTYVPTLNYLSTFGDTRDEALEYTREAILGYLEAAEQEGIVVDQRVPQSELVEVEVHAS